jgi:hypothetical protein
MVFSVNGLCDYWDPYDILMNWKEDNPAGKVTLFAIPRRCSADLLKKYRALDWVELAVNGWWYHTHECLAWTDDDTVAKLKWCEDAGYTKGFRASGFQITREVINGCNQTGFWISGHANDLDLWKPGDVTYIYNRRRRTDTWRSVHGNANTEMSNIDTVRGSKFQFVSEVVEVYK